MSELLQVNDVIEVRFGPYVTDARVVRITDVGAVLEYSPTARLDNSHDGPIMSPDATRVLAPAGFGFLGRAHWHSVRFVEHS